MKNEMNLEEHFHGTATVGERGQIVIPAELRKKFNINPGDKLLVLDHPTGGVVLCKLEAMRNVFSSFLKDIELIETKVAESEDHDTEQVLK